MRDRQVIPPDYTREIIVDKEQQLSNTEVRARNTLMEINKILERPFSDKYQDPLLSRFESTAGRLLAMHLMEREVNLFLDGQAGTPIARAMRGWWGSNRDTAFEMGYSIGEFDEYLDPNVVWVD